MINVAGFICYDDVVDKLAWKHHYGKNKQKIDPIPDQFTSFGELANFGETHDLTDYEDQFKEVNDGVARKLARQFVVTLTVSS